MGEKKKKKRKRPLRLSVPVDLPQAGGPIIARKKREKEKRKGKESRLLSLQPRDGRWEGKG